MATQSDETGTSRFGAAVGAIDRLGEWTIDLVSSEEEEAQLEALNDWVAGQGLPRGAVAYDLADLVLRDAVLE